MRFIAVHLWPEFPVAPATAMVAAFSKSLPERSLQTINGSFPPSSRACRLYPAFDAINLPTGTPPVKVIISICSLSIISSPISPGSPVTIWNISGGNPASYKISAKVMAVRGVSSVGLHTMQLFVAIDGAILWLTIFSGWLKGVIALIERTGSRLVKIFRSLPLCVKSHEKICPSSFIACAAAN